MIGCCILFLSVQFITNLVFKTNTVCTSVLLLATLFADSIYQSLRTTELVVEGYCQQVAVDNWVMEFKFPDVTKVRQGSGSFGARLALFCILLFFF